MLAEISLLYGWKRDYVLWELTLKQVLAYYKYGVRFDSERRGWKYENDVDDDGKTWDEIAEELYTPTELQQRKQFKCQS